MPSKGSRIIPIRLPSDLLDQVDKAVQGSELRRKGEPWTRSSFIRRAIEEKLAHAARSRKPRPGRGPKGE